MSVCENSQMWTERGLPTSSRVEIVPPEQNASVGILARRKRSTFSHRLRLELAGARGGGSFPGRSGIAGE
jgi:hypothetical protein